MRPLFFQDYIGEGAEGQTPEGRAQAEKFHAGRCRQKGDDACVHVVAVLEDAVKPRRKSAHEGKASQNGNKNAGQRGEKRRQRRAGQTYKYVQAAADQTRDVAA